MLKIKNIHAQVEDKDILKGIDLEIKAGVEVRRIIEGVITIRPEVTRPEV